MHHFRRMTFASTALSLILSFVAADVAGASKWANQVTIHRDEWGVPHIDGPTDASVVFGVAYAQCEDYFWQVEDTYMQCIGRYAEVMGESGVQSDMIHRLFGITELAKANYRELPRDVTVLCDAYAAGYNYFLKTHPEVEPRLITHFEPYYVICYDKYMMLQRLLGRAHAPRGGIRTMLEAEMEAAIGSNAWAIHGSRTASGNPMLFVNPHQPWFGSGQFTEMHIRSGQGWNFSGSTFPGGPFPTMGHNEYLGWTHTVNEPDVGDVYRETFDHPTDPLKYKYDDGYRDADSWKDSLRVKTDQGMETRSYTFRKTHHGPIMAKEDDTHYLAVKVAKFEEGSRILQSRAMTKATNFDEWYAAIGQLRLQMFNTIYADVDKNIFYIYNGAVPRRDPQFDWTKPVDGSDPRTEWQGIHPITELPQALNPPSGFVQNCNQSPFTTTDDGNPSKMDFPHYMTEDTDDDKRRAKMSRYLLRNARNITFEEWQDLCYDTTLYWPMTELPRYVFHFEKLWDTHPELAENVEPYFKHLTDWDYKSTATSTQATLCVAWYEELYGRGYPVETLKPEFIDDPAKRFEALIAAADKLEQTFGTWKVAYGDAHRLQRHANYSNYNNIPFSDDLPSLPQVGVRGPLGVAFTVYHTPSTEGRKNRYAGVGASYMAAYEFGRNRINAASYLHYGQSADPNSPHYFDQAALLSQKKFKPAWFYWDEVVAHTEEKYHPGKRSK